MCSTSHKFRTTKKNKKGNERDVSYISKISKFRNEKYSSTNDPNRIFHPNVHQTRYTFYRSSFKQFGLTITHSKRIVPPSSSSPVSRSIGRRPIMRALDRVSFLFVTMRIRKGLSDWRVTSSTEPSRHSLAGRATGEYD